MYFDYDEQKDRRVYDISMPLLRALSRVRYDLTVKGCENIPRKGGLILASNHISFADPAVIVANFPRKIHFMAKSELFIKPHIAMAMRHFNAFPVRRDYSDRRALKYARDIVESGRVLGIFPEGRRVRSAVPDKAKAGVGLLVKLTGADVLPVCLYTDPEDDTLRPRLTVSYGEVISSNKLLSGEKNEVRFASDYIMNEIEKLWGSEYGNKNS